MKPLVSDIMAKYVQFIPICCQCEPKDVVEFFEWAYNEGKKESCNCRKSRKPTKMELATT